MRDQSKYKFPFCEQKEILINDIKYILISVFASLRKKWSVILKFTKPHLEQGKHITRASHMSKVSNLEASVFVEGNLITGETVKLSLWITKIHEFISCYHLKLCILFFGFAKN